MPTGKILAARISIDVPGAKCRVYRTGRRREDRRQKKNVKIESMIGKRTSAWIAKIITSPFWHLDTVRRRSTSVEATLEWNATSPPCLTIWTVNCCPPPYSHFTRIRGQGPIPYPGRCWLTSAPRQQSTTIASDSHGLVKAASEASSPAPSIVPFSMAALNPSNSIEPHRSRGALNLSNASATVIVGRHGLR
jgi:hypothetical protein